LPKPEVFITAERVKRGKPEPDAFLLGAELLGLAPQSAWWWKMRRLACWPG
jgi:beta-phosphoglucomutase-like phosphatase (HAD superfamily)